MFFVAIRVNMVLSYEEMGGLVQLTGPMRDFSILYLKANSFLRCRELMSGYKSQEG